MNELDIVEIYRRRRKWRWRYVSAGNYKTMANGGEAYNNLADVCSAISKVLDLQVFYSQAQITGQFRVSRNSGWPDVRVTVTK